MLAHAVVLEASKVYNEHQYTVPEVTSFIKPDVKIWNDDPLLTKAFDIHLISALNGKGKGTQFCFNPEKDQLIVGNYNVYDIFVHEIYKTHLLSIQPSGFIVFPSHHYDDTLPWVQRNFLNPANARSFSGLAVLEADEDHLYSHYVETLDHILEHRELLLRFFDPEKGHPSHRMALCSGRSPFILPKSFNIDIYNEFREIYNELYEDPKKYQKLENHNVYVAYCKELLSSSERPNPVFVKLEWVKRFLRKGSVFIWNDCIPYRFRCFRAPKLYRAEKLSNESPLICVELNYIPIVNRTPEEIQGDAIAFANKTVSPNPIRNTSFVKKYGNRFERQVVRLMTSSDGNYDSPFVTNGDYWTCIPNPLLFALKGIDDNSKPFLWTDYKIVVRSSQKKSKTEFV